MKNTNINCPHCNGEIALDNVIAAPLIAEAQKNAQAEIDGFKHQAQKAKEEYSILLESVRKREEELETEITVRLANQRPEVEAQVRRAVEANLKADIMSKESENAELKASLEKAQQAQLDALEAKRRAEEIARGAEIEIASRVESQLNAIRQQAAMEAQNTERQKLLEKDLLIERLKQQAEELKRQAQVGSQQLQGDAAEFDLRLSLESAFKRDNIEEIRNGQRGADWRQVVVNDAGQKVGTILWECKNAQTFGADWLQKAKQDARKDKADVVVIVTNVFPRGVTHFDCCEDVWVVHPSYAIQLTKALRNDLIATAGARHTAQGRSSNAEKVYDYLTGPEFVARIKGIAEPFIAMQTDLEKERRTMTSHWARRQKHIERVLEAAFGMRGDIEALAGRDMPELKEVDLKPLPSPDDDPESV